MSAKSSDEKKIARPASFLSEQNGVAIPLELDQLGNGADAHDHGKQHLHRRLNPPQMTLFSLGAAIGTSLFVQMGSVLPNGGPAGLFIGFTVYATVMMCVNNCFAEIISYAPIASPFIRLGGMWVDEAFGVAMGLNYFLLTAFLLPFEIVALSILLGFWTNVVPAYAMVLMALAGYGFLNLLTVRYFGKAEFWLSLGKVILITAMFLYTFITMLGGNPLHDRYGFRYWNEPGAFVEHLVDGSTGRFLGVVAGLVQASFTVCGPEYMGMTAGEAQRPTHMMPKVYKTFIFRIVLFFCVGALCMGIVIPYNDQTLAQTLDGALSGSGTGAASPYVISMERLKISGLPHLVNALIFTSVFSSGNGVLFSASRSLYGLALEGKAPQIFRKCTSAGVPVYCVLAGMAFGCLGFLQVSSSSAQVLTWLVDLVTACQLINYLAVCVVWLHFYWACERQGLDRSTLPFQGWWQPYATYYAMGGVSIMLLISGYELFFPGKWSTRDFFLTYLMIPVFPIVAGLWKIFMKTAYVMPGEADLTVRGLRAEIDLYEESFIPEQKGRIERWWEKLFS